MSEPLPDTAVRASDVERRDVAETLQRHYLTGRLTVAEMDERVAAAYVATTRAQLGVILADLPADPADQQTTGTMPVAGELDPRLLWVLVCVCPPAGLVYWLYTRCGASEIDSRLLLVLLCVCPPAGLVYWLCTPRARS